jgi:hypothetical protein
MRWYMAVMLAGVALAGCRGTDELLPSDELRLDRLSLPLPSGWQQVPPSSVMRAAQVVIPGPAGDAELAVFFFGVGQGGDIEANLQRWSNQVVPDAGSAALRETFERDGLRITWVDVHGTLKPGQMGMGPSAPQPGSRLLGAVIEGAGGPWFLRATGPDATLTAQHDAFFALLHGAHLR